MSVTEHQRHLVFRWLEDQMGSEKAAIMMDLLPPVGWGDIATRSDIGMVRSEIDVLRSEMDVLRSDLRAEMHQLRGDLLDRGAEQTRNLFFAIVASNATLVGLVFAIARLG